MRRAREGAREAEILIERLRVTQSVRDPSITKNDRKIVSYVIKNTFSSIAGARCARADERPSYLHIGAKVVPMRYSTPAFFHLKSALGQIDFLYRLFRLF